MIAVIYEKQPVMCFPRCCFTKSIAWNAHLWYNMTDQSVILCRRALSGDGDSRGEAGMDEPGEMREGPVSRREQERARRRQEILEAAIRVFPRRGFAASTLDEVAQEAGVSKGALYLYFSSKEDILFNILDSMIRRTITMYGETLAGKASFREELTLLYLRFAETTFGHPDAVKVIITQFISGFDSVSEAGKRTLFGMHEEGVELLENRIRLAMGNGELRNVPVNAVVGMIHGSLDSMAANRWNMESIEQARTAVGFFIDILFRGIARERETCA